MTPTATDQPVNFDALSQPLGVPRTWLVVGIAGWVAAGAVFVLLMIAAAKGNGSNNGSPLLNLLIFLAVVIGIAGVSVYGFKRYKAAKARFMVFLTANGWTMTDNPSFDNVATSLLGVGHSQRVTQEFSGTYRGLPMSCVVYEYITGSGKDQETHYFIDMHLTLAKSFPLVVLDDKRNETLFIRDLPERIPGGTKLQLEGDFNDRFNITVMPDSQQDVLQLLTPDFMQELMDCPSRVDIELEANKLYLVNHLRSGFGSFDFNEAMLRNLFAMADVVIKNISEVSSTWQASSSPETLNQMTETAMAARNKLLFRPRHVSIISAIAIAIFVIMQIVSAILRSHH